MIDDRYGGIRLRFHLGSGVTLGPGRVELLELIDRMGSLAAAGRSMGMSYKRAWSIVDELNAGFDTPLVETSRGGSRHGSATLTEFGHEVVKRYRDMLAATATGIEVDLSALRKRVLPTRSSDAEG